MKGLNLLQNLDNPMICDQKILQGIGGNQGLPEKDSLKRIFCLVLNKYFLG